MIQRILCIWIPNWPCQRILAVENALHKTPFVLQTRDARRGLLVAASNGLARSLGIAPGMSMTEATSLHRNYHSQKVTSSKKSPTNRHALPAQNTTTNTAERQETEPCSILQIRGHDPQEDIEALSLLAEAAQQFSPIVGLEMLDRQPWSSRSIHQPQGLVLDVTGIAALFGGETQLADNVVAWLFRQGYCACVGIGDSVGSAWALANFGARRTIANLPFDLGVMLNRETTDDVLLQPEIAREWPEPMISTGAALQDFVRKLPVDALRLEYTTVASLKRLGIESIAALDQLPRDGLAARLGQPLLDRIDQGLGIQHEPVVSVHSLPELSVEFNLEFATSRRDTLEEILRRLVKQLTEKMEPRGHGALRLLCRFDAVQNPSRVLQLGLFRASADAEYMTPLLLGQLDVKWDKPIQIHRVLVQATLIGPLAWSQPDLFQAKEVAHRDDAARLIDSLSNRLGRQAVVAPKLHRDPQPELSCEWRPLTGRRLDGTAQETKRKLPRSANGKTTEPTVQEPLRRPVFLIQPPMRIDVIAIYPEGIPCQFRVQQSTRQVVRFWGPERIESGWWRGPSQRRDYYRIETDDGKWLWIFRELNDGNWFLHGEFD